MRVFLQLIGQTSVLLSEVTHTRAHVDSLLREVMRLMINCVTKINTKVAFPGLDINWSPGTVTVIFFPDTLRHGTLLVLFT